MSSPAGNGGGAPASGGNGNATIGNVHKSTADRLPAKGVPASSIPKSVPKSSLKKTGPIRPPKSQRGGK